MFEFKNRKKKNKIKIWKTNTKQIIERNEIIERETSKTIVDLIDKEIIIFFEVDNKV